MKTQWITLRGPMSACERMAIQQDAARGVDHETIARTYHRTLLAIENAIAGRAEGGKRVYGSAHGGNIPVQQPVASVPGAVVTPKPVQVPKTPVKAVEPLQALFGIFSNDKRFRLILDGKKIVLEHAQ